MMLFGVYYFPTNYGMDIAELAQAVESRGLESLFVCEHTHIPASAVDLKFLPNLRRVRAGTSNPKAALARLMWRDSVQMCQVLRCNMSRRSEAEPR